MQCALVSKNRLKNYTIKKIDNKNINNVLITIINNSQRTMDESILPVELFVEIFTNLELKDLIKMNLISNQIKNLIREIRWPPFSYIN